MRFAFTEDQTMFRDAVRDVLSRECPPTVVRAAWESGAGTAAKVWATLAETGFVGSTATEGAGGMDMTPLDVCLPFEEAGYAALPGPVVETVAIAIPLLEALGSTAMRASSIEQLVTGAATATYARVDAPFVPHARIADLVLIADGDALHALPKGSFDLVDQVSVDRARRIATVKAVLTDATLVAKGPAAKAAIEAAELRGTSAVSAYLVGLSRRMLDLTVEYAKVRHQFGRPIGSFQAVKHKLADALIKVEFAKPMVHRGAYSLAHDDAEKALHVAMGKIYASECATFVAKQALQVHGAIGYTIECDLHFFMKRAWALAASYGDTHAHRRRIADLLLGPVSETHGG